MDCGTLIVVAAVLGGIVAAWAIIGRLVRSHRAVQARPAELRALAPRLGLTFSEQDPELGEPLLERTLYAATFSPPANRLSGVVDGLPLDVFDSAWHTGGRTGHYRTQVAVVVSAKQPRWPRFVVQGAPGADEPGDSEDALKDLRTVALGQPAFDAAYTLAARSLDDVRPAMTAGLTTALVEFSEAGRALTVESHGDRLVCWRGEDAATMSAVEQLVADARRVRSALDAAVGAPRPG